MSCSGCGSRISAQPHIHPILNVPLCDRCHDGYHSGEFTISDGNEIYCRWCGEGEGELLLCDSCPKAFCTGCIGRNFGKMELLRIQTMSDRWNCLICSPLSFYDLCKKNGWNTQHKLKTDAGTKKLKSSKGVIHADISRGREKFEIPVINEVDKQPPPLDFVYVNSPVCGGGITLTNNPDSVSCCSCTDGCQDPLVCECLQRMGGAAYDMNGILLQDKPGGIYECNQWCSCNATLCKNRVVGSGPHLRLEVFRCENPAKGWGVRCRNNIYAGTYVADYIGEVMLEADAEQRGLVLCDEYLFTLDNWGRTQASQRLEELGMKQEVTMFADPHTDADANVTCMTTADLAEHLDRDMVQLLQSKGAVDRALRIGKRLREDPESFLATMDRAFSNNSAAPTLATSSNDKKQQAKSKGGDSSSSKKSVNDSANNCSNSGSNSGNNGNSGSNHMSWADYHLRSRVKSWNQAASIVTDRVVIDTEEKNETYIIDARWLGSVGRFFNHTCSPNLDIISVFCESHDKRMPRVAFFANDFIPAYTELCYDYGYYPGNVEGKHRACLCGSVDCRKTLY